MRRLYALACIALIAGCDRSPTPAPETEPTTTRPEPVPVQPPTPVVAPTRPSGVGLSYRLARDLPSAEVIERALDDWGAGLSRAQLLERHPIAAEDGSILKLMWLKGQPRASDTPGLCERDHVTVSFVERPLRPDEAVTQNSRIDEAARVKTIHVRQEYRILDFKPAEDMYDLAARQSRNARCEQLGQTGFFSADTVDSAWVVLNLWPQIVADLRHSDRALATRLKLESLASARTRDCGEDARMSCLDLIFAHDERAETFNTVRVVFRRLAWNRFEDVTATGLRMPVPVV